MILFLTYTMISCFWQDGVLTIEAPLPALASGEKLIPIAQN